MASNRFAVGFHTPDGKLEPAAAAISHTFRKTPQFGNIMTNVRNTKEEHNSVAYFLSDRVGTKILGLVLAYYGDRCFFGERLEKERRESLKEDAASHHGATSSNLCHPPPRKPPPRLRLPPPTLQMHLCSTSWNARCAYGCSADQSQPPVVSRLSAASS